MQARQGDISFPFGLARNGLHEITASKYPDHLTSLAFAFAVLAQKRGEIVWISEKSRQWDQGQISAAGLAGLGIIPDRLLKIDVCRTRDGLWSMEEAARAGIGTVLADLSSADFTQTRRLSLASARYGVSMMLVLPHICEGASAAQARWRVTSRPSAVNRLNPKAPGFPRWSARLERSREAPDMVGQTFHLEYNYEAFSLRMVPELVARPLAADTPDFPRIIPFQRAS